MNKIKLSADIEEISGIISLPASKSISNRVLVINALSYSPLKIDNLAVCEDTDRLLEALYSNSNTFYTGDGGTTIRFLTAFLSKIVGEWTVNCSERMKERPIGVLVDALNTLGAQISYLENEGYPPLKIMGSNLSKSSLSLSGSVSSQYITALLLIAPTLQNGLELTLNGKIVSRPYIQMTLDIMAEFGVKSTFIGNKISVKPQAYKVRPYKVESDWSGASYWYELVALAKGGSVFLEGLRKDSFQGDAKQVAVWEQLGVKSTFEKGGVLLEKSETEIARLDFDFCEMPDLAQTFAVACALKGLPFCFTGLETLKIKETNRVVALMRELKKLGFILSEPKEGSLEWQGDMVSAEENPSIATYRDHRMAMAFAPVSLRYPIKIENPKVVNKSYPKFWEHLRAVGFQML